MLLKILAFILPLGLDSFAVAAALGTRRPTTAQRWRISGLFVVFEAGMPLIGLAAGAPLARLIGSAAEYIAAGVLVAVGAWMMFADDGDDEKAGRLLTTHGWTVLALGLSMSLDELAIGFTLGLAHLPVVPIMVAIAAQALVASQLGFTIGARIGEVWRERTEQLAGLMLAVLGLVLIGQRLLH